MFVLASLVNEYPKTDGGIFTWKRMMKYIYMHVNHIFIKHRLLHKDHHEDKKEKKKIISCTTGWVEMLYQFIQCYSVPYLKLVKYELCFIYGPIDQMWGGSTIPLTIASTDT